MSKTSQILTTVDIEVPVRVAYDQWTQFRSFPEIMQGVRSVEQLDDTTLRWEIELGEERRQWLARITEQTPDHRIAWKSIRGTPNSGVVTFHRLSDNRCRVTLQIDYEVSGFVERFGDSVGFVQGRVHGDLERFKYFLERRNKPTGAWRGVVEPGGDDSRA